MDSLLTKPSSPLTISHPLALSASEKLILTERSYRWWYLGPMTTTGSVECSFRLLSRLHNQPQFQSEAPANILPGA
jgi:hypothetical protein